MRYQRQASIIRGYITPSHDWIEHLTTIGNRARDDRAVVDRMRKRGKAQVVGAHAGVAGGWRLGDRRRFGQPGDIQRHVDQWAIGGFPTSDGVTLALTEVVNDGYDSGGSVANAQD